MRLVAYVVDDVDEVASLDRRLRELRPDVDRWAAIWPPRTTSLWSPGTLILDALERPSDLATPKGRKRWDDAVASWMGRVIEHLVIVGPFDLDAGAAGALAHAARRCSISLWLIRPSQRVVAALNNAGGPLDLETSVFGVVRNPLPAGWPAGMRGGRRCGRDTGVLRVSEGFLRAHLPTTRVVVEPGPDIYRAHFVRYAADARRAKTSAWRHHRHVAQRGHATAASVLQNTFHGRRCDPCRAFASLFTTPTKPAEALARLRGLQLELLRAGWLREQDDYADSVRLVSLLAAGHAHLGLLDLDVRLNYLATHDIVTSLRPSIRR